MRFLFSRVAPGMEIFMGSISFISYGRRLMLKAKDDTEKDRRYFYYSALAFSRYVCNLGQAPNTNSYNFG
jgi:hypothetical protein